jgi:hypothetical protein
MLKFGVSSGISIFLFDRERNQNQKKLLVAASEPTEFVSERHNSDTHPRSSRRFHASCVRVAMPDCLFRKVLYVRHL